MTPTDISEVLNRLFGAASQQVESNSWQIQTGYTRLLILLSEDGSWLRSFVSIAPEVDAEPYLAQILEANFDETQEVRYALHQQVLWGVFQHSLPGLTVEDFQAAIARLLNLQQTGLGQLFNQLAETQIRQIIQVAKQQGQTLEATLQTLERFYREGVMGGTQQSAEQRERALGAWRYQLERLWNEESQS